MIYFFEVDDLISLNESFVNIPSDSIWMYVYKSENSNLGFDTSNEAKEFVYEITSNAFTLVFPDFKKIASKCEIEKKINDFRGITFYGNNEPLSILYDEYDTFLKKEKKNQLLKRYGKDPEKLIEPTFYNWFNDKKITDNLISFCKENCLEFIIWDWSNFGIHFYHLGKSSLIEIRIQEACTKLNIQTEEICHFDGIPYDNDLGINY